VFALPSPPSAPVAAGYKVYGVVDASGTYSKMATAITIARLVQAGVFPIDTAPVASELHKTWNRPDAKEFAGVYASIFPNYQLLIESYQRAQSVATQSAKA
jgi:hypothetical protein